MPAPHGRLNRYAAWHGGDDPLALEVRQFDLVYFDAFSPTSQPELWSQQSFEKIFALLRAGGVLTTYCSRSAVRRTMAEVGFKVEKIPGPWGKREMVRAHKPYTTA